MEVIATREGHYGKPARIRRPGDKFTIADKKELSSRWMLDMSTPEGQAYDEAFRADPNASKNVRKRDKLTGERLAAGGIAEQLAVTLEENTTLTARIAELEAQLAELTQNTAPTKVEDPHPSGKATETETNTAAPVRKRRTSKPRG